MHGRIEIVRNVKREHHYRLLVYWFISSFDPNGISNTLTISNLGYLMRRVAVLSVFLTYTICAFWLLACWETSASDPRTTTSESAVTEGSGEVLHLYTALDTNEAKIYIRAFEEETGIQVRWVRLSAGEVLVRIRSERTNPQVALWFGGPSPEFLVAKREGITCSLCAAYRF